MSSQNTVKRRIKAQNKDNEDTEDAEIEVKEVIHRVTSVYDFAQPGVCCCTRVIVLD